MTLQNPTDPNTLLPCPFCGGADIDPSYALTEAHGVKTCSPGCMDCGAMADTLEHWNTRAPSAELTRTTESVEIGSKSVVAAPQTPRTDRWQALYDDTETVLSAAKEMRQLETELTQAKAEAAAMRAERDAQKARFAAINGQINVMANAVNGQRWEAYWDASDAAQKIINGDFDHAIGANFEAFRRVEAERDAANALVARLAGALEKAEWVLAHSTESWPIKHRMALEATKAALAEVAKSLSPRTTENTKPQ